MTPARVERRASERGTLGAEKESPRNALLVRGIEVLRPFAQSRAEKDRALALYAGYFLRMLIRDPKRSLVEAVSSFTGQSTNTELSSELRTLFSNLAAEFATQVTADLAMPVPRTILSPAANLPDIVPARPRPTPASITFATASDGSLGGVIEQSGDLHRVHSAKREDVQQIFLRASAYAESQFSFPVDSAAIAGRIDDTVAALLDVEQVLQHEFGFRAACIRSTFTAEFEQEYAAALARAESEHDTLHHVEDFKAKVREYIGIRARVAVMLRREQVLFRETQAAKPLSPFAVLGVAETATAEDIEAAYLVRLRAIDPDDAEDAGAVAMLHGARTQALEALEKAGDGSELSPDPLDEVTQPLPLVPPSSLDKIPSRGTVVETPVKVPEVAFSHSVPKPALEPVPTRESWLVRRLRAPGAKLRMLLFGAGAAISVAGVTTKTHVVEGYVPEPTHERAEEPRGGEGIRAFADGAIDEANEEAPEDDAGPHTEPAPEATPAPEIASSYHIVAHRETLWQILGDKIRARGLPVTNAKILMLKHLADTDNPGVYWENLKPGQVIQLESVDTMLDAMEGKGRDASGKAQGASGEAEGAVGEGAELKDASAEKTVSGDGVDSGAQEGMTVAPKAYESLPTSGETMHRMAKGENVYTLVHQMLRSRGLNWTTERINFLTQLVVDKNADLFREMVKDGRMRFMHEESIPVGAVLDFSDAVQVIDEMGRAKQEGKKAKTVRELAKARGYGYPIMMKFPKS